MKSSNLMKTGERENSNEVWNESPAFPFDLFATGLAQNTNFNKSLQGISILYHHTWPFMELVLLKMLWEYLQWGGGVACWYLHSFPENEGEFMKPKRQEETR